MVRSDVNLAGNVIRSTAKGVGVLHLSGNECVVFARCGNLAAVLAKFSGVGADRADFLTYLMSRFGGPRG